MLVLTSVKFKLLTAMNRVSLALPNDMPGLIVIVAIAEPFLAGGARFFEWNPSKKATIVAVYDIF